MGKNKVTIKDIAQQAGVGIGTVSRVLNNNPNVSDSTRMRVLDIAAQMHYVPNGAARMLVARDSTVNTVGILYPLIENQFFFEILKALNDQLKTDNYNLMIFNTEDGHESAVNHIVEQRMAGMIVMADNPISEREKGLLSSHRIPYLHIDSYGDDINFVRYDTYQGGRLAADYLLSRKCKKVLLIGESNGSQQQADRFAGFAEKVGESGSSLSFSEICIAKSDHTRELCLSLMNDPDLDGLFFFSDEMAFGGIQAKEETGKRIAVIGYDDIFPSRFLGLSTVRQSSASLGKEAGRAILSLIRSGGVEKIQRVLTPILIDRNS